MIYLASPYSSPDPAIRKERFERVSELTVKLLREGRHVFSPLTYSHELAERFGLCGSWAFWERLDLDFLERCDEVWVYQLPGWRESVGVTAEVAHAKAIGKRVWYYRDGSVWNTPA